MFLKKLFYPFLLLLIVAMVAGCDSPTAPYNIGQPKAQFVIFNDSGATNSHITSLIFSNILLKSQIKYRYENKGINGFYADLTPKQVDRINSKKYVDTRALQGQFIIVFKNPFHGKKYGSDEGHDWAIKTIRKLQKEYNISDDQILHRYGWGLYGFAAKLNGKQLYELCNNELVNYIGANDLFKPSWPVNR